MNQSGGTGYELEMERAPNALFRHVAQTYAWMCAGLLVTYVTGYLLYSTGMINALLSVWWVPFALLIAKLFLVSYLSSRIHQYSVSTARGIFILYSALTGVVFASILAMYYFESVILVFGVTALFFGCMAAAGLITKRDLSGFAPIVMAGLVTLLVLGLISMFLDFYILDVAICFLGVIIFMGVTTYDAKKMKDLYYANEGNTELLSKLSIYSALDLYLDFINLFLYLIRLLGKRR